MTAEHEYAVVMRMEGMFPEDIGGFERHRTRKGGDLSHVDPSRGHLNRRLIGKETWAQDVLKEIREMRIANFADELETLKRRRRTSELEKRLVEGPKNPWRATRHGPLREVILTVNRKWFEDDIWSFIGFEGNEREEQFEKLGVAWLEHHFGDDVVHARADRDEAAYHIHAVIVPRAVTKDGRRMLQPSKHEMIRNYEKAQDSVGEWFSEIGLVRGERRKQALRDALEHNRKVREAQEEAAPGTVVPELVEVPKQRWHVSPRQWREAEEQRMADGRRALGQDQAKLDTDRAAVAERGAEAEAILAVAAAVASGEVEVSDDDGVADLRPTSESKPAAETMVVLDTHRRGSPKGFARAVAGMAAAWTRLRNRARSEVAEARAEIEAADEAIVRVAQTLPENARKEIAQARTSLTARILRLAKRVPAQVRAVTSRGTDEPLN